jgi:uncharacterized membrane protein YbhN (UPF0104 family)
MAPVALVPFVFGMAFDAAGQGVVLRVLGHRVGMSQLLPIRFASEALHLTAPAGFVVADSATAALLDARAGVPLCDGGILAVARKWLVTRAHAAYILLGALAGSALLTSVSERHLGGPWLAWGVGASALLPLALSVGLGAAFYGKRVASRIENGLRTRLWPTAQNRTDRWRHGAEAVDTRLAQIGQARDATWLATAAFFAQWLVEAAETALVLYLVGGPLDARLALGAEVGVSLLRSIGNFVPAGLGVQDAGYATLFPAMGVAPETAAAFVLVKRCKEVVWIGAGYMCLALMQRFDQPRAPRPASTALAAGA